jgi:Recombination endonuclease VII
MASSSRKKRARKGGNEKKGTRGNEENRTRIGSNKKKRATKAEEKELAKQRRNECARKRYAEDADYREKLLAYQREYQHTHNRVRSPPSPEQQAKYNANARERYATDPEYRAATRASKRKQRRKNELKHRYGLSWEDYQAMLARQDGKCAICECEFTHTPFVDHCHITGKVRRLLCRDCNTGLARFKDDPYRVLAALQYLLEFLGDEAPFTLTVVPKARPLSPADPSSIVPTQFDASIKEGPLPASLRCDNVAAADDERSGGFSD